MKYVLDTNVLLFYVRDDQTSTFIEENYGPFHADNEAIISIVSVAEIMVLASASKWGERKLKLVQRLIDKLVIVELTYQDIIDHYIEIEQFNRNIHPTRQRTGSHIKMGKNDVWIAATTVATGAALITADKDFAHLDGEFFNVLLLK